MYVRMCVCVYVSMYIYIYILPTENKEIIIIKAFCPFRQNPLAGTSGFALTLVRPLMISPSNYCNRGSISTSL